MLSFVVCLVVTLHLASAGRNFDRVDGDRKSSIYRHLKVPSYVKPLC